MNDLRDRTKQFALGVIRLFNVLPQLGAAPVLGRQLLRSGTSIGANYREAFRSRSKPEFLSKIGDCLKEADETAYWLELLDQSSILPSSKLSALQDECNQLLAIFSAISKTTKASLHNS